MVFLGGIIILARCDLTKGRNFSLRPLARSPRYASCVSLALSLSEVSTSVWYWLPRSLPCQFLHPCVVDDIEVGQQQRVKAPPARSYSTHRFPAGGLSLLGSLCNRRPPRGAVGITTGVDNAGMDCISCSAPETTARQIDDIVCGIHMGDLLVGRSKSDPSMFASCRSFPSAQSAARPAGASLN